jgi:glycosyltransferase involved in cell wall biosynthesis
LKIGWFTSIEGWGGSEIVSYNVILRLKEMGEEPVLFGVEGSKLFSSLQKEGIQCAGWKKVPNPPDIHKNKPKPLRQTKNVPLSLRLLAGNLREASYLVRVFRLYPVDVMWVNVHGYEMAGVSARLCRIPCAGYYHTWPVNEQWWIRRWFIQITAHFYNICTGVSRSCMEAWRKYCKLPARKCRFVLNGIDIKKFKPCPHVRGNKFRLLTVARLHPMKGLDVLIRAMAEMKDENIMLTIAGEGDEKLRLQNLAEELGVAERVIFAGYVEEIASLYSDFDCFVLPSISHEACPSALLEAMACGLPVITSDFGPLPELNLDGVTGLVVPAGDSKKLAEAIRQLACSEELCVKLGYAGLERARKDFTQERMVKEIIEICKELADGS